MKRFLIAIGLVAFADVAIPASPVISAPAKNWSMMRFTRENYRLMTLRGSEARVRDENQIDVVNLNLTGFTGDASNRVETIVLSTAATFLPKQNLAHGDQGVRLIRDDMEATGMRWTFDHVEKKVSLHGSVHIVINAELKNILK
ncbi:MAG: hypothetical protein JWM32_498 [Verrucomicrobia bacterium]|nr:hypothetical protein [Verrucomicrobiota bacterium]